MGIGSNGDFRSTGGGMEAGRATARRSRVSQLRKLQECEQVAAVCYRVRGEGIEFLLVQTRGGRWTFPKGSAEPGLTHAQAAALEAFEEAGVHGRMEHAAFARYVRRKRGGKCSAVLAHLCEVLRLSPPQESRRNPTWFSPEKAKRRLREDRSPEDGVELARVVDRAVTRIQALRREAATGGDALENTGPQSGPSQKDALQRVQFEAGDGAHIRGRMDVTTGASIVQYVRRQRADLEDSEAIELAVHAYLCKVLQLSPPHGWNRNAMRFSREKAKLRLPQECTSDDNPESASVVEIDNAGGTANRTKAFRNGRKSRRYTSPNGFA